MRVRRPLAQADVQRLACVGAGGEVRVIPEPLGVAVGGTLLLVAADLAEEAVTSTTSRAFPGPAPAFQARSSARPSSASSWRTCPNVNTRKNVPNIEGAGIQPPGSRRAGPARSTAQSSMLSAPSPANHAATRPADRRAPRSQLRRQRRDQHHSGARNDPLIVEADPPAIQGHSSSRTGQNLPTARWMRASGG